MIGFRRYHAGDTCPECGKRKLYAATGRSLFTFGRPRPWLLCEGHPRCGFATRRIASCPAAANDNRAALLQFH
jgi:hypothetical protein